MNAPCTNVRELIPLFPDDLDSNESALVREHVARCSECAAELGVYAAQAAVFSSLRDGRPKIDLFAGIQEKLAQPAPRGEVVKVGFGGRALFAAAAAGIVVAWGLFSLIQKPVAQPKNDEIAHAPTTPQAPAPKKPGELKLPGPQQTPGAQFASGGNDRAHRANRTPRRRFFEPGEGAMPWFGSSDPLVGERELVPLDEEAEIPQTQPRKQRFATPPSAQPNPAPKTGDDESLRF